MKERPKPEINYFTNSVEVSHTDSVRSGEYVHFPPVTRRRQDIEEGFNEQQPDLLIVERLDDYHS